MPDIDLWKRLCAGDKSALKVVYEKYAPDLLQYGYKLSRDRTVVEDALQEIFIHCWEKRATLPDVNHIRSYLYTAIRRKIYRKLAYKPRWKALDGEDLDVFECQFSVNETVFEEIPDRENLIYRLRKMISQLSLRQKEIVYLKYFEGMDYDEIETIMGINYQSSRNLLSRALNNLRDLSIFVFLLLYFQ